MGRPYEEWDYDEFVDAAARALWVASWADAAEDAGESLSGELMDQAPDTPDEAVQAAHDLAREIESANKMPLAQLWYASAMMPGKHYDEPTVRLFGHYLAMESLGHGVAWTDDHPNIGMVLPHFEFHVEAGEGDQDPYWVAGWG
jgi:hypothetical protein